MLTELPGGNGIEPGGFATALKPTKRLVENLAFVEVRCARLWAIARSTAAEGGFRESGSAPRSSASCSGQPRGAPGRPVISAALSMFEAERGLPGFVNLFTRESRGRWRPKTTPLRERR